MSRKKSLRHIDFIRYQEQNAFKKRLQACILAIAKWKTTITFYEDRFYKMLPVLKTPSIENIILLPYQGHKFRSICMRPDLKFRYHDTYRCLSATLAFILMQWWNYQSMLVSSGRINHMLNYLENIIDKGLDSFEIQGNIRKGWRLREQR